jgi:hypothetical protein
MYIQTTKIVASPPQTSTTTTQLPENQKVYRTSNGKELTVIEDNDAEKSMSTLTLIPFGFTENATTTIETNKLNKVILFDMNKDGNDEIILVTTSVYSGNHSEAIIFTTASSSSLLRVQIPDITEESTVPGSLFEGYTGLDTFNLINDIAFIRSFPIYISSGTEMLPNGKMREIIYELKENQGDYFIYFKKNNLTATSTN